MAKALTERSKSSRGTGTRAETAAPSPRRQRLWRDLALIVIAPLLLYLLASLFTFSPTDPGWSHSGSITAPLHNLGGRVGAWITDVLLYLCGYVAFLLPFMLGAIAWIALFGMDTDGDGEADLGPALRLVGIVGFLVSSAGLLTLRVAGSNDLSAGSGGVLGRLVGNSLDMLFGALGANLFLISLFLISVTLATGLSWLAVMDRIGGWVLAIPGLLGRGARQGAKQASEWNEARSLREERVEARKADSELRAKRTPVKIEPPAAPVVEKSDRAKREQQMFHAKPRARCWKCRRRTDIERGAKRRLQLAPVGLEDSSSPELEEIPELWVHHDRDLPRQRLLHRRPDHPGWQRDRQGHDRRHRRASRRDPVEPGRSGRDGLELVL